MAYLYGASAQGIQEYIFATSKLREMVGGSELVEAFCTEGFNHFLQRLGAPSAGQPGAPVEVLGAAGNLRWIFEDESLLQRVVSEFPLYMRKEVPGLNVSQAIVPFDNPLTPQALSDLEDKLKAERNCPAPLPGPDWAACARCPRTGLPAYDILSIAKKSTPVDEGLFRKNEVTRDGNAMHRLACKMIHGKGEGRPVYSVSGRELSFPHDLEHITKGRENTWLAVVHADGNALGVLLQTLAKRLEKEPEKTVETFHRLSEALDAATCAAAQKAFQFVIEKWIAANTAEDSDSSLKWLPLRPLILGGDDLTVIIRADLAIDFTEQFLASFEQETAARLSFLREYGVLDKGQGLTACAGIAFIKTSYPFYYAYDLTEALCKEAKAASKAARKGPDAPIPASLAFFKVQSSFIDEWSSIRDRELTIPNFMNHKGLRLDFGPYATGDGETGLPSLRALRTTVDLLRQPNAPVSGLRRWLTLLYDEPSSSESFLERLGSMTREDFAEGERKLNEVFNRLAPGLEFRRPYVKRGENSPIFTPVGDILTLLGMEKNQ